MSKIKPSLPKGMRDFPPEAMAKRNYIISIIREVFQRYGFQQIETPAMENMSTLTGKYGEEGDKLLFKVLNSGDYLAKSDKTALQELDSGKLTPSISEKGLHYDLTVPLARYVVMHQHDIAFPFKRYQIQPVWRADRPQKGRYREFYQCDGDILGSDSLLNEVELLNIIDEVFSTLGMDDIIIKFNNRKILAGIAATAGIRERFIEFTIIVDKLDKMGKEGVFEELKKREFSADAIEKIDDLMFQSNLNDLQQKLSGSETGQKGLEEVAFVQQYLPEQHSKVRLDLSLARGLDYYTGTIFEVVSPAAPIGSLAAGGRYDDLTRLFGLSDVSGVGFSFGLERMYDALEMLGLFPKEISIGTQVLFLNFGSETEQFTYRQLQSIRTAGISAEMYTGSTKIQKQMKYANARQIPFVIMIGSEEQESGLLTLKDMRSGEQQKLKMDEIITHLS